MRLLKTTAHFSGQELYEIWQSQKSARAFSDWQIIYSVQTNLGKKAEELASFLGVSTSKIYHVKQSYNKKGKQWRSYDKWGGRREEQCILSLDEEAEPLKEFESEALSGSLIIYKHIKEKVEVKAGREVSDDYIWDLFKRHGWEKKVPGQSRPKGDELKREEFKKNSKKTWQPNL